MNDTQSRDECLLVKIWMTLSQEMNDTQSRDEWHSVKRWMTLS